MAWHLVRFGECVEVVAPDELREELARIGRTLVAAHAHW